jgi:Xaa-Pro aminopeptidase
MHEARIQRLRSRLASEELDALLVTALPNIYYLSGFTGSTAVVVVTRNHAWFITDFRYHEQVGEQVPDIFTLVDNTGRKLLREVLPSLADSAELRQVGFESQQLTHALFSKLAEVDSMQFVPTDGWIEELRIVKDAEEIERLRASVRLNERVFTELLDLIGPEVTEADLAAEIHYRALKYGAKGYSFEPIIASGTHSAKPHAGYSTARLVPGQPLTIDMGLLLDGYCSDMTRTVFYRDCPPQWEKIYTTVREAKDRAFAEIRPGRLGKEIDAVARELINGAGYEGKFEHGLGHGVGVEVHEQPTLSSVGERKLEPGMVVTDEPGIYLAGEGGVRIEDMVVVRADGAENLNELDTELRVVG